MKTDDLISALVADTAAVPAPIERTIGLAVACGFALAAVAFFSWIGPRPDIAGAAGTVRFLFKFFVTLALLVPSIVLVFRLVRPGAKLGWWVLAMAIAPLLLLAAVALELAVVPASEWVGKLVGSNARFCLTVVPLLSIAPLCAILIAMRHGAATEPRLAGAIAGVAAAGFAATLYASHCIDDNPLFVAVWYTIAIAIVAAAGSILGGRVLRW